MIEVLRAQEGAKIKLQREEVVVRGGKRLTERFSCCKSGSIGTHLLRRESCGKA